MSDTAKVFMTGRSQAIRLPREYRFDCKEVFIRRDPDTGDLIISSKPESWDGFFERWAKADVPDDFMDDRDLSPPQERDSLL